MLKKGCLTVVGLFLVLAVFTALSGGGKGEKPAVTAGGVGPSSTAPAVASATATPRVLAALGTPVALGNWGYAVLKVERAPSVVWSKFGNETKAKGEWLVVHLGLVNNGKENFTLNYWDLEVHDDGGIVYNPDAVTSMMLANHLDLPTLGEQMPPGVAVRTVVLFDVNPRARGLRLYLVQGRKYLGLE